MTPDQPHTVPKMRHLATNMARFQVVENNRGSARGDVLDRFLARLNPSRVAAGYKPYTHARLSLLLQHIKGADELEAFYKQCEKAGIPFSAFFHWSLKPKNRK